MTDFNAIRNEATEEANKALEFDESEKFEEAFKAYLKAAEKLNLLLKLDDNKYNQEAYKKKALEFIERAKKLKECISTNEPNQFLPIEAQGKETEDTDVKLEELLASCVIIEKPKIKWSDVAGLYKVKEDLQEAVILPMKFPKYFQRKKNPWKGVLLYGPPGCGKTFLAKACVNEVKGSFYTLCASSLVSQWIGDSVRIIKKLFEIAKKNKPAVIFIDEIDLLLGYHSESESQDPKRVRIEFLLQMQKMSDDDGILILGATNTPWNLDPDILKRFEKKIYVPLPETNARLLMFKLNLGDTPYNIIEEKFKEMAELTKGYSGSDIRNLTQDAILAPIKKCHNAKYFRLQDKNYIPCSPSDIGAFKMTLDEIPEPELIYLPDVCEDDFVNAMSKIKPTVSESDITRYETFTAEFEEGR